MTFGERLRRLYERDGMSRAALAKESGVSYNSIQRYESGETSPTLDKIRALAAALNLDPADLVGDSRAPAPGEPFAWVERVAQGVVSDQRDVTTTREHVAPVERALREVYVAGWESGYRAGRAR